MPKPMDLDSALRCIARLERDLDRANAKVRDLEQQLRDERQAQIGMVRRHSQEMSRVFITAGRRQ